MSQTVEREPGRMQAARREVGLSRRGLLASAGMLAALAAGMRTAKAAPPPASADVDPSSLLNRLVRRLTYGESPEEIALARTLGYQGYLEYHLNAGAIDDSAMNTRLAAYATLPMTYQQMLGVADTQVANECIEAAIIRAAYSKRQFFERMVEFWTDHFNIEMNGGRLRRLKSIDDRDVIRPHALGNFADMLAASARSPAMLDYLDNNISTAGNPNENYAREIMELHTMGADGGYTQQDVAEVARCFTGWQFYNDNSGALSGTFRYNQGQHDTGQKVVLGQVIPARPAANGMQDGIDVMAILLAHPSTARYVSSKLCRWLLGDAVPAGVVDQVAAAFTSTGGDIKSMIRAALAPNNLAMAAPKYKRPWHHFISCLRGAPSAITSTTTFRTRLSAAGMPRFGWPTPDGYPDATDYWVGLIIPRWNFGADLMNSGISGLSIDAGAFFAGLSTADQMVEKINQSFYAGEMPAVERDRIRNYMLPNVPTLTRQREALGLAMSSPFFQWF
ncbi:MAG: DUF1800 domain-containing protein [Planctomycetota bacterium]|nr:DUF1800 domain-containing protein [Planctomycetota bacterium]